MSKTKHNINDKCTLMLTRIGQEKLERWYHDWGATPPEIKDGKFTAQMWEVMNIFGPALYNGCKMPFHACFTLESQDY